MWKSKLNKPFPPQFASYARIESLTKTGALVQGRVEGLFVRVMIVKCNSEFINLSLDIGYTHILHIHRCEMLRSLRISSFKTEVTGLLF